MAVRIATILGTRPQYIKYSVLQPFLRDAFDEVLIDTNQHYDDCMARIFFEQLGILLPDYNLNAGSGSHGHQIASMLVGIEDIINRLKPHGIVVFGDTNSTLAGALIGRRYNIPVCHVEAGLRSNNIRMPEEQNRMIVDRCSELLYCPSESAAFNLRNEGITDRVYVVGDIQYEATKKGILCAEKTSEILQKLKLEGRIYHLLTIHRAENTSDPCVLLSIFRAIEESGVETIFPVHPGTYKVLKSMGVSLPDNVNCIEPLGYLDFLLLIKGATKVITDSGGIQKEAYYLKTPCIILREETEWTELTEGSFNLLAGTRYNNIYDGIMNFKPINISSGIYGDGSTSRRIIETMQTYF